MSRLFNLNLTKFNTLFPLSRSFNTHTLSEHSGFRLKVSLFLERQPLEYSGNHVESLFRDFRDVWSLMTNNSLKIPSISNIERKITHRLTRSREKVTKPSLSDSPDSTDESPEEEDLESLLSQELDLKLLPRRSRRAKDEQMAEKLSKLRSDDDLHNINRLPKKWVFLLVKYKDSPWSLPVTDLYYGDSIRDTLVRLCQEHISTSYRPYFLGHSPFTHQLYYFDKRNDDHSYKGSKQNKDVIEGEKVFFYRARHVPSSDFDSIENEKLEDYCWVTLEELTSKLDRTRYRNVLNSIPLYNLTA